MLSRRAFVTLMGCAGAARAAPGAVRPGCQTNAWRIDPNNFEQFLKVLERIRSLGFQGFETSFRNLQGQFSRAAEARRQIERTGLTISGVHIFLAEFDRETALPPADLIERVAQGAARLGAERVVLSGRGLLEGGKLNAASLRRKAEALNATGERCRRLGLRVAYHNEETNWSGWVLAEEERDNGDRPGDSAMVPAREYIRRIFGV